MKNFLNKLTIKRKIFILVFVPSLTLIILAALNINDKLKSIKQLENFHTHYLYYEKVASLINHIDNERYIAFGFISANGLKYKEQLNSQRVIIDNKFKDLLNFIAENRNVFDKKLYKMIQNNFDFIEIHRYDVDTLNLFLDIENNFYSDMVYNLLYSASNIPAMTNNKSLSNQTLAYKYLIEAKEYLSLKTGLLNYIVNANKLTVSNVKKLQMFDEFYKSNNTMFKYFANEEIKNLFTDAKLHQYGSIIKFYNKVRKQNYVLQSDQNKVKELENILIDMSSLDINSIQQSLLQKTSLVKIVERKLSKSIIENILLEKKKFEYNLQIYIMFTVLIVFFIAFIGILISKNILKKIINLEEGLIEFLKYIKRDNKRYKPLYIEGNDEINHMADIINDSMKETVVFIQQEVEKEKVLFKQVAESEKMVQMGEMIGNIAHQWRQPLSLISTMSSTISLQVEAGQRISEKDLIKNMDIIVDYTKYLSNTIDIFRDYLKENKELKVQSIQDNIESAHKIVYAVLDDCSIIINDQVDYSDRVFVNIVTGELPQVLINIINNSKDAILKNKINDPWIKISMEKTKNTVTIIIEDNGGGIPSDVMAKIFEPYFTTKHQSQGTGLGLYMSYKMVTESMGGSIYVANGDHGAIFSIELPRID